MESTTLTIRTDPVIKAQASEIYEELGLNMTTAINMFLRQTVIQRRFPCSIELSIASDYSSTYPRDFFSLFGSGKDSDIEIPEDIPLQEMEESL